MPVYFAFEKRPRCITCWKTRPFLKPPRGITGRAASAALGLIAKYGSKNFDSAGVLSCAFS